MADIDNKKKIKNLGLLRITSPKFSLLSVSSEKFLPIAGLLGSDMVLSPGLYNFGIGQL
ncbi:MAG: hypothetical protein ACTSYU_07250 [Promethearchaeota archaeon]